MYGAAIGAAIASDGDTQYIDNMAVRNALFMGIIYYHALGYVTRTIPKKGYTTHVHGLDLTTSLQGDTSQFLHIGLYDGQDVSNILAPQRGGGGGQRLHLGAPCVKGDRWMHFDTLNPNQHL